METVLAILLGILYVILMAASLVVGLIGGVFVSIYHGFANYIASLVETFGG